MAFLSTVPRFGPDLDKCCKEHPNPFTYDPGHETIATAAPPESANRYGTFGFHHDAPLESVISNSDAAKRLAVLMDSSSSSSFSCSSLAADSLQTKSPSPWQYTPKIVGQFDRVFTVADLTQQQRDRRQQAQRTPATRSDGASSFSSLIDMPPAVQRLALGPGTYEVDKDWNLETIAVPFSFGKEPRRGILECSLGEKDLQSDGHRQSKYSKRLSSDQRRRSETALLPLRRVASGPHGAAVTNTAKKAADVAAFSKELAKSYADLDRSATRLERQLASPVVRNLRFQRFGKSSRDEESFRRGPGSYMADLDRGGSASPVGSDDAPDADENGARLLSLPLDDQQRLDLAGLLVQKRSSKRGLLMRKKTTSFGTVKHRDLLTSLAKAGHLSAVAVDDAIGPGTYETGTSTLDDAKRTHNISYKHKTKSKPKTKKPSEAAGASEEEEPPEEQQAATGRSQWLGLCHGPQWTSSSSSPNRRSPGPIKQTSKKKLTLQR